MKLTKYIFLILFPVSIFASSDTLLPIGFLFQNQKMDCWAACIAMAVNYYENNTKLQTRDISDLGPAGWETKGVDGEFMIQTFRKFYVETMITSPCANSANIQRDLSLGKPTLLYVHLDWEDYDHAILCVGYDNVFDYFIWYDPDKGDRDGPYDKLISNYGYSDRAKFSMEFLNPPFWSTSDNNGDSNNGGSSGGGSSGGSSSGGSSSGGSSTPSRCVYKKRVVNPIALE